MLQKIACATMRRWYGCKGMSLVGPESDPELEPDPEPVVGLLALVPEAVTVALTLPVKSSENVPASRCC